MPVWMFRGYVFPTVNKYVEAFLVFKPPYGYCLFCGIVMYRLPVVFDEIRYYSNISYIIIIICIALCKTYNHVCLMFH